MESPATWGPAERAVDRVLDDFSANQDKPITDPTKTVFGPSLARLITDALRAEGLMKEDA